MTVYYVATLARYVLVEAPDGDTARELGARQLAEMFTRTASAGAIQIRTVREATPDEIAFDRFHHEASRPHSNQ